MTKIVILGFLSISILAGFIQGGIVSADQTIINIATTSSQTEDPNQTNNTVRVVDIIKDTTATVTGHVFYDLNGNGIQESGEPDLANVDITAKYSDGTEFKTKTDPNGNYVIPLRTNNVTITIDKNDLDIPAGSVISTVGSGGLDIQSLGDGKFVATAVGFFKPYSDVSIIKTVNTVVTQPNQNIVYNLAYRNKGVSDATNVQVTDLLPNGFTYQSANINPSEVFEDSGRQRLTFIIPTLLAGEEGNIQIVTKVGLDLGSKINESRIISALGDPEISNNLSTVAVEVYSPTNITSLVRTGGVILSQDTVKNSMLITALLFVFIGFIWKLNHHSIRWSKPKV